MLLPGGPEQRDGAPHGYSGASADVWSLGVTLFEALVGARAFDGHWLPAYEDYRRTSGPRLLANLRIARAAMGRLVLTLYAEPRAQPTNHAEDAPALEAAVEPFISAVEVPAHEGEAALNAAEAARARELARAFARVAFACAEPEPGTRPTALEVLGRARVLQNVAHNLNGAPAENDELPLIDGGERDEGRGAALLIADPPRPATAGARPHASAALARAPETAGAEPTQRHRPRSRSDDIVA